MKKLNIVSEVEIIYKTKIKTNDRIKISSPTDSYKIFKNVYNWNKIEHKEMVYIMLLNRDNKILGVMLVSEGGTSSTIIDPKIIFQAAIKTNASAIILCHNHPSGNKTPSENDIKITKKIKKGGQLLDITLLDHLIITPGNNDFLSFSQENLM